MSSDKDEHNNISVILMFCRYCGDDFAGIVSRKMSELALRYAYGIPQPNLLPQDKQRNVRLLLKDYFESAAQHLLRLGQMVANLGMVEVYNPLLRIARVWWLLARAEPCTVIVALAGEGL